jgi:diguanylate cyclase (GGDEF)-like protein
MTFAILVAGMVLSYEYARTAKEVNEAGQLRYRSLEVRDLLQQGDMASAREAMHHLRMLREPLRTRHHDARYFIDPSFPAFAQQVEQGSIPTFVQTMAHVERANQLTEELARAAQRYLYAAAAVLFLAFSLALLSLHALSRANRELLVAHARLEQLATTDALTGSGNRRKLFETLNQLRSEDSATECAIILADIDHFKSINDEHGHPKGDEVLMECVRLLSRPSDVDVYRDGGEEFAILVRGSLEGAINFAESLRKTLHESPIAGIAVTASFGVATMKPGEAPVKALARADRALYVAKRGGRNRVSSERQAPRSIVPR